MREFAFITRPFADPPFRIHDYAMLSGPWKPDRIRLLEMDANVAQNRALTRIHVLYCADFDIADLALKTNALF